MKLNVVMPMAGEGSRFVGSKYLQIKPLIPVGSDAVPMFTLATLPIKIDATYTFIIRSDTDWVGQFEEAIENRFSDYKIIYQDKKLEGPVLTTLLAKHLIDNDNPLLILDSDQYSVWDIDKFMTTIQETNSDGGIITFTSDNPSYSYVSSQSAPYIADIAEKKVISNTASSGSYFWSKGSEYIKYAEQVVSEGIQDNKEFYVSRVYKRAINDGKKFIYQNALKYFPLGTPESLYDFEQLGDDSLLRHRCYTSSDDISFIEMPEHYVKESDTHNSVIKLNNFFRLVDLTKETKIIKGKTYIANYGTRFWHFINEEIAQYEVLKNRVPDLNIFFIDTPGVVHRDKPTIVDEEFSYCDDIAKMYLSDQDYEHYFINKNIPRSDDTNLIFEELYVITEYSNLISEKVFASRGYVPPWYSKLDSDWKDIHWVGPLGRDSWIREGLNLLRQKFSPLVEMDESYPKKIYISRKDSSNRYLKSLNGTNDLEKGEARQRFYDETDLEHYFSEKGYEVISFENLPYLEQLSYIRNADVVAGLVGSAFVNLYMAKNNIKLLEIHVNPEFHFSYEYMFRAMGFTGNYVNIDLRLYTREPNGLFEPISRLTWPEMAKRLDSIIENLE